MALYSFLAALIPLNNYGHFIHWHWLYISYANFIVICLMVITFVAALLLPFPGHNRRKGNR